MLRWRGIQNMLIARSTAFRGAIDGEEKRLVRQAITAEQS
jgi:hypothetical protein